jgi:hypothetical protein
LRKRDADNVISLAPAQQIDALNKIAAIDLVSSLGARGVVTRAAQGTPN